MKWARMYNGDDDYGVSEIMRRIIALLILILTFCLTGCGATKTVPSDSDISKAESSDKNEMQLNNEKAGSGEDNAMLQMKIGNTPVVVDWENNESVEALRTLCQEGPLTIQMSMYGGFEQVGPLGQSIPRDDVQTTTQTGDIVLYSGNQIVVFYGSNSWAYTRLGHISDKSAQEMAELLGNGDVTITIEKD